MAYCRPSEMLKVKGSQVIGPTVGSPYRHWAVVLHPRAEETPSKILAFGEVIAFDLPKYKVVEVALRVVAQQTSPNHRLFNVDLSWASRKFVTAAQRCGVECLNPQLYQLRHSGPSVDIELKIHTLQEVKLRGRWRSDNSMARYTKPSRLNEQLQRLPPAVRREALLAPGRLSAHLKQR